MRGRGCLIATDIGVIAFAVGQQLPVFEGDGGNRDIGLDPVVVRTCFAPPPVFDCCSVRR